MTAVNWQFSSVMSFRPLLWWIWVFKLHTLCVFSCHKYIIPCILLRCHVDSFSNFYTIIFLLDCPSGVFSSMKLLMVPPLPLSTPTKLVWPHMQHIHPSTTNFLGRSSWSLFPWNNSFAQICLNISLQYSISLNSEIQGCRMGFGVRKGFFCDGVAGFEPRTSSIRRGRSIHSTSPHLAHYPPASPNPSLPPSLGLLFFGSLL